jgi:hypothetical protein
MGKKCFLGFIGGYVVFLGLGGRDIKKALSFGR